MKRVHNLVVFADFVYVAVADTVSSVSVPSDGTLTDDWDLYFSDSELFCIPPAFSALNKSNF